MSNTPAPLSPLATAHDYPVMVPAPEGVDAAISAVMERHRAELDEALAPFGVLLDDLARPTMMRFVSVADVIGFGGGSPDVEGAAASSPADDEPFNCCGAGEVVCSAECSAPRWTRAEREAEAAASAPVNAPRGRFGRGGVRGDDE